MPQRRFKGSFLWFCASFRTFSLSATTAIEDVPVLFKDDWGGSGGSGGSLGSLIRKKLLKVENVFNVAETDMIN